MKRIIALLILLPVLSLHAQKKDTVQKYLDQRLKFTSRSKAYFPAVGIKTNDAWFLKAMYPDTTVLLLAYFKDKNFSVKNGPYKLFHTKNVLAIEGTFVDNVPQGVWRYYYPNKQIKDSGALLNNTMIGTWNSWDEKGQLLVSVTYNDKPRDVNFKVPKGDGSVLPNMSPVGGERDGYSVSYFPSGKQKDSIFYKNNKREGIVHTWYENGNPDSEGSYKNDSLDGDWTFYRENGNKSTDEKYKNGKLLSLNCYDSAGNNQGNYCSILKPPIALGDFDDFDEYMLDNIFWPKNLDPEIQGIVKVEFVITKKGEITNFKVVESPHQLLSDEVTRFFSSIERWSPAISHNRIIDFPMKMEVPFLR